MITVIIPSTGRDRLKFSLLSLLNQTNPNWRCIVAFDNVNGDAVQLVKDERISYIFLPEKLGDGFNGGGEVRNKAIEKANTEWICFLDDDDSFKPDYFEKFYSEVENNPNADVIIFKMIYSHGGVLPPPGLKEIIFCQVGISFAVKLNYLFVNDLKFENSPAEDFKLLTNLKASGANIHFSDHVVYNVGFSNI